KERRGGDWGSRLCAKTPRPSSGKITVVAAIRHVPRIGPSGLAFGEPKDRLREMRVGRGCRFAPSGATMALARRRRRSAMAPPPRAETLARIPLFRTLSAAAVGKLDRQCAWKRAAAGQWLLDYEDASNDVFFVVAGAVRVIIQSGGREVLLREIKAGEFFGELAAIDHQPRSSGIMAVLDVTIGRMPASVFRSAVHEHPDVCDQLLTLLAGQIRMLANRVHEFATLDVPH